METLDFIKKLLSELDESWSIRDVKNEIELFLTNDRFSKLTLIELLYRKDTSRKK